MIKRFLTANSLKLSARQFPHVFAFPFAVACFAAPGAMAHCEKFAIQSVLSDKSLSQEVEIANGSDRKAAYQKYVGLFHPDVKAYGIIPNEAAVLDDLKEHYRAVFFELDDGALVEDDVVVAGEMAAHRYHSMMTLNGEFDGVEAKDKRVVIRGQTFFRFNNDGRIIERWSNHDHGYRMAQLSGDQGRKDGDKLAKILNGPGVSEEDGYEFVDRFVTSFSMAEVSDLRDAAVSALIADNAIVHGVKCGPANKSEFLAYLSNVWVSFPDLYMGVKERPMSGWSMVAFEWDANGSLRSPYEGLDEEIGSVINWDGQMIVRLNRDMQASEIWFNAGSIKSAHH